jgi:heptosyltransferase-3
VKRDDAFESILVICTRQIGDVLLTTPLIRAAKQRWPQARIDVLGFAGTLGMLEGNPDIDACIEVQAGSGWLDSLSLIRRLWRRYDLALVTQRSDRAHLYGWVAARVRSGLVPGDLSLGWWKHRLLDHAAVVNGEETHVVVEKFHLLDPWLERPPAAVSVTPPGDVALPEDLQRALVARSVVVHVPSMWRYKQWPLAYYRTLIAALLADGLQVVLTGGRGETDQAQVAAMRDLGAPPALLDASGRLSLAQVASLLRRVALYIGPDTSVTHLAAACDVPVITMFGPTNPQLWGPWPQRAAADQPFERCLPDRSQRVGRVILLQGPNDCVPCSRAGCEHHVDSRSECLEGILPERVLAHARALLAGG